MNAVFLDSWKLYRRGPRRPGFAGEAPRGDADFDADVKVGEIRVFADGNQPLTALIAEDCGLSGRRIVPVSPFAAPASARELVVGGRVLQLWNATLASRRFTDRSWRVDALSAAELAQVLAALPAACPGRLTAGDGPQARYEREFLVSAGNFVPWAEPRPAQRQPRWFAGAWSVAAAVALFLGVFALFSGGGRRLSSAWHEVAVRLSVEPECDLIELVEPEPPEVEYADLSPELILRENAPKNPVPAMPEQRQIAAGRPVRLPPEGAGMELFQEGLAYGGAMAGFVRPSQQPVSALMAGAGRTASAPDGRFSYAAGAVQPVARPGAVECTLLECPWDTSRRLLNVVAESAAGLKIEVAFDPKSVVAYRLLSNHGEGSVDAFYEIVPPPLSGLADGAVTVTTRWYDGKGERMRDEQVRTGSADGRPGLPQFPRKEPDATGATSPDDIPVKVNL